jgi:hypothetical protein
MKILPALFLICSCLLTLISQNNPSPWIGVDHKRGDNLTIYKLAVSCSGEYTSSVDGAVNAKNNLDAWLILINEMYGREYRVRLY